MNSFYKRVVISVASTTILHASIFYTLNEVKEPQIITPRTIEIALLDAPKMEKKEEIKPKETLKELPKKVVKQEVAKPTPVVKQEKVAETKAAAQPKEEAPQEAATKPIAVAQNDSLHINKSTKVETPQKASQEQKATSKIAPNILEAYLFKVRAKIQENLRYPSLARRLKLEGESVVGFEILDNGGVVESSCEVKKSSGHKTLDREAIETILSVLPFEAPPSGKISIIVPVAFNLK
ncbi:MAG: TonB family protein [Sulfurimonas sp.]|uniref:TonB family protein n=1 Tax=Sulfurimonas sp. TaxID=2022749 RepID=UPI00261FE304|nr:TonB family protein [Sulfurimonas sp.]MDD3476752.1 TonB family protein [Sulfurimonas sp.]